MATFKTPPGMPCRLTVLKCNTCGTNPKVKGGRECKACKRSRFRAWYEKNKDEQRKRGQAYRAGVKEAVIQGYGSRCVWCGESDPICLVIDHVNNDGHLERKHSNHGQSTMLHLHIIRNNFPKNYQLLCANCNTAKAINKGVLPKHRKGIHVYPS
jgi:hypothetical protein